RRHRPDIQLALAWLEGRLHESRRVLRRGARVLAGATAADCPLGHRTHRLSASSLAQNPELPIYHPDRKGGRSICSGLLLDGAVLMLGWLASLVLFFSPQAHAVPVLSAALALVGYQLFGSQATFFELSAAALLDGKRRRTLLVPFSLFNFFASTGTICNALVRYYLTAVIGAGRHRWHKTMRF